MLPWGHLAVGYLVYAALTRLRLRRSPTGVPTIVLVLATQLPDLVDKPLNWWFGILDGRGVAHSVLVVAAVCVLAAIVAAEYDRTDIGSAFSIGLFSHLFADALQAVLAGQFGQAAFLLWPLFPAPTYPKDAPADHVVVWLDQFRAIVTTPAAGLTTWFGFQLVLVLVALVVWIADGAPGLDTAWRVFVHRRIESLRTTDR